MERKLSSQTPTRYHYIQGSVHNFSNI